MAALGLARAGDRAAAEKLAAELDKTFRSDTLVQRYWLPTIRAAIALEHKDPNRAIGLLSTSGSIELGQPTAIVVFLCPVYLRGEAYLMLRDGNATTEFRKFFDHRGLVANFSWGAFARLGMARATALSVDSATALGSRTSQGANADAARIQALAAYKDFLTLWKDADSDIPILEQAKAEYAKLQ
jgi:hypothetical protein